MTKATLAPKVWWGVPMKFITMTFLLFLGSACAVASKDSMKNDIAKRLFDLFDRHTAGLSDHQIAAVRDKRPELPRPFNLAVYFKQPDQKADWRWTRKDKDGVLATVTAKKSVKYAFELINTSGSNEELESLRLMSAQQGADALLVIQGVGEVETDANGLALSYIALVPMLFANGNNVKSTFVTQAVLWDVRNAYVHLGTQSEGDWMMKRPLAFRQKERALEKAKEESLQQLEKRLSMQLGQIKVGKF